MSSSKFVFESVSKIMNAIDNWLIVNYFGDHTKDQIFTVLEKEVFRRKPKFGIIQRNLSTIIPLIVGIFNAVIK